MWWMVESSSLSRNTLSLTEEHHKQRSAVRIRPSLQCLIKEYRVMTRFFQFVIVGIILGAVLMLLASIVSSCYFFITTFTLSDFEERTCLLYTSDAADEQVDV